MKLKHDQTGLIPMIIFLLALVIGMIVVAFLRVRSQNGG